MPDSKCQRLYQTWNLNISAVTVMGIIHGIISNPRTNLDVVKYF